MRDERSWRSADGETHEDTEWFRVVAWNKLAEICHQWLIKGSRVYIEGRMQTRQWQDQEGQSRSLTEIITNDIIILDSRRDQLADTEAGLPAEQPVVAPPRRDCSATSPSLELSSIPRAATTAPSSTNSPIR